MQNDAANESKKNGNGKFNLVSKRELPISIFSKINKAIAIKKFKIETSTLKMLTCAKNLMK